MKNLRMFFSVLMSAVSIMMAPAAIAALPAVLNGQPLPSLAPMLDTTTPGVVNIATRSEVKVRNNPLLEDPFFRHFFNVPRQPRRRATQSLGSGVIVDAAKGYILTNHHVIAGADEIAVTTHDGLQLNASVVGADPDSDVAVIQVRNDELTAVPWGDSDGLRVGDFVVAIGNPFGLGQTVTSGIVSALGRSGLGIEAYEDFIQTDASINPGNSGGALVDLNGHLIGINTAIIGPSGGNIGIGFAIPARMARLIMEQLIEFGEVRRGRLGVAVQDLNAELASAFGLQQQRGAVISQVQAGSPGEQAGLRAGDIVVGVNGRGVKGSADMRNLFGLQRIGEVVNLKIVRDGEKKSLQVVIAEPELNSIEGQTLHPQLKGAKLGKADTALDRSNARGLLILDVEPHSPASASGLHKGDLVTSINRRPVGSIEEAKKLTRSQSTSLLLNIQRGNMALYLVLH